MAAAARDLPVPGPPVKNQVLPRGPADRDSGRAAGLLGPQHHKQRDQPPRGHLQARKRGQAARVRYGSMI
jgi:hypothetical protein